MGKNKQSKKQHLKELANIFIDFALQATMLSHSVSDAKRHSSPHMSIDGMLFIPLPQIDGVSRGHAGAWLEDMLVNQIDMWSAYKQDVTARMYMSTAKGDGGDYLRIEFTDTKSWPWVKIWTKMGEHIEAHLRRPVIEGQGDVSESKAVTLKQVVFLDDADK